MVDAYFDLNQLINESVFGRSISLLYGTERYIDETIFEVFPNCWMASFTLGLFWRSLCDIPVITELCRILGETADETGHLISFLFARFLLVFLKETFYIIPS